MYCFRRDQELLRWLYRMLPALEKHVHRNHNKTSALNKIMNLVVDVSFRSIAIYFMLFLKQSCNKVVLFENVVKDYSYTSRCACYIFCKLLTELYRVHTTFKWPNTDFVNLLEFS